ncbi:MAG TPA: ABC transporter substrate-binding protein [Alphaproteobacteria bacterium]
MMRSPKALLVAAATAAALLVTSATQAADPVKIRMAWVVPVANWAPILMEKKDLMQNLGKSYMLEPVRFQGTPPMITALASGDLEIADLAYSSLALAIENAGLKDLKVIADEFQDGIPGYYSDEYFVRKDSGIDSVKDLKGKVIATNAAGSAVDIAMRAMLRKNGLDDRKDVNIVEAPFPNMKAMLFEKKVDLIPGVLPFSMNPELRQQGKVLFTQSDAIGETQMIVWAAREGFIEKNRAAMVDFMADALRVVRWYLDPKNHEAAVKVATTLTKTPPAVWDSWLFTKKDYYRNTDMLPNLKALQANIDLQRELGFLKSKIDVNQHADLSIVKEAAARLK